MNLLLKLVMNLSLNGSTSKLKREPDIGEVFDYLHSNNHDRKTFVDGWAQQVHVVFFNLPFFFIHRYSFNYNSNIALHFFKIDSMRFFSSNLNLNQKQGRQSHRKVDECATFLEACILRNSHGTWVWSWIIGSSLFFS